MSYSNDGGAADLISVDQWFLTGGPWPISGPQHVNLVGHGPLYILKIGLHAE